MRAGQPSGLALRAQLVLTAFLMLFIELALIRWLGANVRYLAYFSNVVLLGSFLGIGLGFLWTSRSHRSLFPLAPAALAALIVLVRVLEVRVGISGGDLIFFGLDTSGPPLWIVLPIVFVVVAAVMPCIGDGVARSFQRLANLDADQPDLVGSLLGSVASRFRDTVDSTAAFGANLLGAMVGGLLEYTSLIIGYRHLLLLVAVLYGAAFLLRPEDGKARSRPCEGSDLDLR